MRTRGRQSLGLRLPPNALLVTLVLTLRQHQRLALHVLVVQSAYRLFLLAFLVLATRQTAVYNVIKVII
jgi:hypothetical protein